MNSKTDSIFRRRFLKTAPAVLLGFTGCIGFGSDETIEEIPSGDYGGRANVEAMRRIGQDGPDVRVDPADGYERLQSALNELGSDPGVVTVGPGTIDDVDDNIVVPANTRLSGAGTDSTTLAIADGTDLDLAGLIRVEGDDVAVSDLTVDGNRANVSDNGEEYGLYSSGTENLLVERVQIRDCPGYGFDPHRSGDSPGRNLMISDCVSVNNGLDGFTIAGIESCTISDCRSHDNDRHGFNLTDDVGAGVTLDNCESHENGACGMVVQNGYRDVAIDGGESSTNGESGVLVGTGGGEASQVRIDEVTIAENGSYGVQIRGSEQIWLSVLSRANAREEGNAEISIQETDQPSTDISVVRSTLEVKEASFGIDERDGNGPTTVVGTDVSGDPSTPINLSHPDSTSVSDPS